VSGCHVVAFALTSLMKSLFGGAYVMLVALVAVEESGAGKLSVAGLFRAGPAEGGVRLGHLRKCR
jgi:hypothetical protein